MKKTLCIVLITAMLLSLMPMAVFADTTPTGTAITSVEDLKKAKNDGVYYLANDITITGEWDFNPGAEGTTYRWENATLDGNGKTIYYADGTTVYGGLIREANNITIKNLTVKQLGNTTYIGSDNGGEVSPLIRRVVGGTVTISNVTVEANVVMTSANEANQGAGFVAALNRPASLSMTRCVFKGSITKEHQDSDQKGVGGMLGGTWTDGTGIESISFKECINYANITSATYAGGIFGFVRNNGTWSSGTGIRNFTVTDCINYGNITCTKSEFAGGLVGFLRMNAGSTANIKYNVNYGSVTVNNGSNGKAGGIAGGIRQENGTKVYSHGNVNYGALAATSGTSANIANPYNASGSYTFDRLYNFCADTGYNTMGSGGEAITESTLSTLNGQFGDGKYVILADGKIGLAWANPEEEPETPETPDTPETPEGNAITTVDQLKAMADNETYYLANDIHISGEWQYRYPVVGTTLDGNGHTIYYEDGTTIYGGFFREANGVTIKNLNIVQLGNTTYIGNDNGGEVSPLIRRVVGGTVTISNVAVEANVVMTSANGANQCGGMVAQANGGTIKLTRCVFDGSITKAHEDSDKKGVSGMIGGVWNSTKIYMTECINYADITSATNAGGFFGGYRGNNFDGNDTRVFEIISSINYGDITVTGASQKAGGFVGYYNTNPGSTNNFRYNVNYGKISATGSGDTDAGGFAGHVRMPISSSYKMYGFVNYGEISANRSVTNVIGYLDLKGDNSRDNQSNYGYSDAFVKGGYGSNSTLITTTGDALCTTLNNYFSTKPYTVLPNGKVSLSWAKEAGYGTQAPTAIDATLVGTQLSGHADDASRSVRFIGGLNDYTNLDNVGVLIIATFNNGAQKKVFEGKTNVVYTSILADGEDAYAEEYGKTYFYTAVVNGIPTSLETVTFEVRTFQLVDDAVVYSNSITVDVDLKA